MHGNICHPSILMQQSNLYQLIQTFSALEQKSAQRFLESPFFNHRQDINLLFQLLCREKNPDKLHIWSAIYPGERFDDTRLRLLMSYLNRLLETFLLVEQHREKNLSNRLLLAAAYRNRGLMGHYDRNIRLFEREIAEQPLRNAFYHSLLRDYFLERQETTIKINPADLESLRELTHHTDVEYLTHRLRLICLELSQKNVYRSDEASPLHQLIIGMAERSEWAHLPGIATYLSACNMLNYPEEYAH